MEDMFYLQVRRTIENIWNRNLSLASMTNVFQSGILIVGWEYLRRSGETYL